jgi:hypothetical protein
MTAVSVYQMMRMVAAGMMSRERMKWRHCWPCFYTGKSFDGWMWVIAAWHDDALNVLIWSLIFF